MKDLIASFPEQLKEALSIVQSAELPHFGTAVQQVLIVGMGGSGIGARYVQQLVQPYLSVPLQVMNGYRPPAWVGNATLGIASSYSGNTEETLEAFREMRVQGAIPLVITSGGELLEMARAHGLPHITLPAGWPAPRACLGFSLVAQLIGLHKLGVLKEDFSPQVKAALQMLTLEQEAIMEKAERLAGFLTHRLTVLYTTPELEPVAVRFRQQLAENAKQLSWHHVIPEMNHNEIVGWHQAHPQTATVFLTTPDTHPRNQLRTQFVQEITARYSGASIALPARGRSPFERMMYLTHLTDWVSWFIAEERGIDAMSIQAIDFLKEMLSRQS